MIASVVDRFAVRPVACGAACAPSLDGLLGSYVGTSGPPEVVTALLQFARFPSPAAYLADLYRREKGVRSDVSRAARRGYRVSRFAWRRYLHDVVAINASAPVRQGRPMSASYRRTVEEMGGADPQATEPAGHACAAHWRETWGVFAPESADGVGGPLVAYCSLVRTDNLALYSMWLGHRAHLGAGIMHALHAGIVEHLMTSDAARGVEAVMYAGWNDGGPGLQAWKRRLGFRPTAMWLVPR